MAIETIDIGEYVECDDCSEEYTGRPDPGGLLFGSRAICPKCAPKWERNAKQYQEEHFIKARCPTGMPFAAWVLSLRGGDNTIRILTGDDLDAAFGK